VSRSIIEKHQGTISAQNMPAAAPEFSFSLKLFDPRQGPMNRKETIFIVDDDLSVRRSLSLFLSATGYQAETFGSSEEYLEREPFYRTGCILLDVNMEEKTGWNSA